MTVCTGGGGSSFGSSSVISQAVDGAKAQTATNSQAAQSGLRTSWSGGSTGASSTGTLLTGPTGVASSSLSLGRTTLLGQ